MNFNIIDVPNIYQRLLDTPDSAAREAIFCDELIKPFDGLIKIFGGDGLASFKMWGMTPDQFAGEDRAWLTQVIDGLTIYDAWNKANQSLADAKRAFAAHEVQIPIQEIVFALMVADLRNAQLQRGYTGFGGIPGYIMTVYSEANDYTLPRIQACTVHELHHNIRFAVEPFNMMAVTVGQYIVAEGLAEAFAAELYGEDLITFAVLDFDESRFEEARSIIGKAVNVSGFNEVRGYIFGDVLAESMDFPKAGVPNYAGYAIGYKAVRQYLQRTGKTAVEATFIPWSEIIEQSGFFA